MGRKRGDNPLGLPARVYAKHGAFYYVHRDGRWEKLGTDVREAKRRGEQYNDPGSSFGTMAWWLGEFITSCQKRVGLSKSARGLSRRTVDDYTADAEPLKAFFGKLTPDQVKPTHVGQYLQLGAETGRPVRANREKACLSACFTWLILQPDAGVTINPCVGVKRNPEFKRERYVTDAELLAVLDAAPSKMVRGLCWLIYRTLQRPEDILKWSAATIVRRRGVKILRVVQSKTEAIVEIAMSPELDAVLKDLNVNVNGTISGPGMKMLHKLDGEPYTYDGLCTMLKRAIAKARKTTPMQSFGFYDLKGKGATDMWRSGVPLEQIQALCGHESVTTTEVYVKQRWNDVIQPNSTKVMG